MRKLVKGCALIMLIFFVYSASAQNQKFGHIDLQGLIQVMPERASAENTFSDFQKDLEDVLEEMNQNYQTKLSELEKLGTDASEVKRNAKINELQELQQRIQNYQMSAQQQLQQKYNELLEPIFEKAEKVIEEVAKEQGLLYVFDTGTRVVLYKSNQSIDVLPFVKKKLGIE